MALRLDIAAAALNPFLRVLAAGLMVLYVMLYIGMAAPGLRPGQSVPATGSVTVTPSAISYPAPPDFVR